jgi:hypothetical protein
MSPEGHDNGRIGLNGVSPGNNPDVLFVLNLDIGSGKQDKISFKSTDTPENLALQYCRKNNFNIQVYDLVSNALREK